MKVLRVVRGAANARDLAGAVLCHDVSGANGGGPGAGFRKGHRLTSDDVPALMALDWPELHLVVPDAGDLHEEEAGGRVARAAAGAGVEVRAMQGGHWPIVATRRGLLGVSVGTLGRVNGVAGVCVYTLFDGQVVDAGETVARAKITPFLLEERLVRDAERLAGEAGSGGLIDVRPFLPMPVGAVIRETLGEKAMRRARDVLQEKLAWFGATLVEPRLPGPDAAAVAAAIEATIAAGARIVIMAGTKAMDPLDPTFVALDRLGIPLERYGVPAHPGSLLWLARRDDVTIVGLPNCGVFSQATVFDIVLARLLTGERVDAAALSLLGHGGLLTREMAFRFPPYRGAGPRGELPADA